MSILSLNKVIANLPSTLQPNSIYAVRVGSGFDLYISDKTGQIAHKVNPTNPTPFVLSGFPPKPPGYNDYVVPYALIGSTTTLALTASRIYWIPFYVDRAVQINQVAINVTTAVSGTHTVGIYLSNDKGEPTTLLISWLFDTGSTGIKTSTFRLPYTLQSGVYWLAWAAWSSATVRAVNVSAVRCFALASLGTSVVVCWLTSGSTLPDTAPTSGYNALAGSALPAVGFLYAFP